MSNEGMKMHAFRSFTLSVFFAFTVFSFNVTALSGQGQPPAEGKKGGVHAVVVRTDDLSIDKGKKLFDSKCGFCHDTNSTEVIVGPGLKEIMKRGKLPVSQKPPTPENIANQLRDPFKDMPSFSYLAEDDILNIIAYLNTL
jgi:cytochrome c2